MPDFAWTEYACAGVRHELAAIWSRSGIRHEVATVCRYRSSAQAPRGRMGTGFSQSDCQCNPLVQGNVAYPVDEVDSKHLRNKRKTPVWEFEVAVFSVQSMSMRKKAGRCIIHIKTTRRISGGSALNKRVPESCSSSGCLRVFWAEVLPLNWEFVWLFVLIAYGMADWF